MHVSSPVTTSGRVHADSMLTLLTFRQLLRRRRHSVGVNRRRKGGGLLLPARLAAPGRRETTVPRTRLTVGSVRGEGSQDSSHSLTGTAVEGAVGWGPCAEALRRRPREPMCTAVWTHCGQSRTLDGWLAVPTVVMEVRPGGDSISLAEAWDPFSETSPLHRSSPVILGYTKVLESDHQAWAFHAGDAGQWPESLRPMPNGSGR